MAVQEVMQSAPNGIKISSIGAVTKPTYQPAAFRATPSANLENFAINQYNNVDFASERFDEKCRL